MMQRSFAMVVAAPFLSVAAMYAAKQFKKDVSYSERFIFRVQQVQNKMFTSSYARSTEGSAPKIPLE